MRGTPAHGRGRPGTTATPEHQRELGERLCGLPAHPGVHGAITRLRAAGFRVVTLTNSVAAWRRDQLRNAGLRPLVDAVYRRRPLPGAEAPTMTATDLDDVATQVLARAAVRSA